MQFPYADISLILSKLRGPAAAYIHKIKDAFIAIDADKIQTVTLPQFQ